MNNNYAIKDFFSKLKENQDILGIILFGSRASGDFREDSDVDLIVIQKVGSLRTIEYSDSIAFEITYTTPEKAIDFWKNNPDDCYWLWKSGKIILDRNETIKRLREEANNIINNGKKPLDDTQIKHLHFDAKDQIKAAKKIAENEIFTANLILTQKVYKLTELFFDIRQEWTPPPKHIISGVEKISEEMSNLLKEFYKPQQEFDKKLELAEKIISIVFENRF